MPLSPSSSGHCVVVCFLKVSLQLPDPKTWTDVFGSESDDVLFVVQTDLAVKKKKTTFKKDLSGLRHAPQPLAHLKLKKGEMS